MNSIRARFEEIAARSAKAGYPNPQNLMRLTPREMEWALEAFAAEKRRELELADAAAWFAGRYVALALNAPGRYPSAPDGVIQDSAEMTDAEMRRAFERLSKKGGGE